MRISGWSSDVCASDLTCPRPGGFLCSKVFLRTKARGNRARPTHRFHAPRAHRPRRSAVSPAPRPNDVFPLGLKDQVAIVTGATSGLGRACAVAFGRAQAAVIVNHLPGDDGRSEEHTSELQSLMRISYAVFCLKKKKKK